jgi:hypothetical protein
MTVHPKARFAIAFLIALALILAVGTVRNPNFWRTARRSPTYASARDISSSPPCTSPGGTCRSNGCRPSTLPRGFSTWLERHFRSSLLVMATLLVVATVLVFAIARLWWRVAAYFEAVHLAPLNPQVASPGAASHRRAPID